MKWTEMLVVSLRGVNFGFWSRLGCSGQNAIIFKNYLQTKVFDDKVFAIIKSHCTFYLSVF